jgi:hypothetical protein
MTGDHLWASPSLNGIAPGTPVASEDGAYVFLTHNFDNETFTISFTQTSTASSAANLAVAEFQNGIGNFIRNPSPITVLSELPYGQLPEVPWAAGLPLVGLGVGMWLWKRQSSMAR